MHEYAKIDLKQTEAGKRKEGRRRRAGRLSPENMSSLIILITNEKFIAKFNAKDETNSLFNSVTLHSKLCSRKLCKTVL